MRSEIFVVHKPPLMFWPLILTAGFFSALLPEFPVLGYRWTAEFFLGVLTLTALVAAKYEGVSRDTFKLSNDELIWVVLPLTLFALWSGLSIIWADSWRNALHHTLLWSCYLAFYLVFRNVVIKRIALSSCLKILAIFVFCISVACLTEFVGSPGPITEVFTFRYYSYDEAFVALLPLFLAIALGKNSRWSFLAASVACSIWAITLVTASRTMFIASIAGLFLFVIGGLFVGSKPFRSRRLAILIAIFAAIAFVSQIPLPSHNGFSVSQRFSGREEDSVRSARSRLLLWGMALEGFKQEPITGIGADNYFTDYKILRGGYSQRDPSNPLLELNEELIPERAHNEFLQVLCELGVVGAIFFGWMLVGILYLAGKSVLRRRSLISAGALVGIIAFLITSAATSYSFRFPANGLCFFFLVAIAMGKNAARNEAASSQLGNRVTPFLYLALLILSAFAVVFSAIRGVTVTSLGWALNTTDQHAAETYLDRAIDVDGWEPMFRYYLGQQLLLESREEEAIPQLTLAIDRGLAASTSFYQLAEAQSAVGQTDDALKTYEEAIRVYPRSVFLLTAYSSLLKRTGRSSEAALETQVAVNVNERQAVSWQLAHDEGLEALAKISRVDTRYISTFDLRPSSAPLAVANVQSKGGLK